MNWLNNMISDIQNKLLNDGQNQAEEISTWGVRSEQDSVERLHQFQSRLADLDKRILELR